MVKDGGMKILYVYAKDTSIKDIPITLCRLGYEVKEYPIKQDADVLNDEQIDGLVKAIREQHITHLFSVYLIYNLAVAADRTGVKYISYIWDAPYIKLYTPFGRLHNCYYSVFDRLDYERFRSDGIPHVQYSPLAVNPWNVNKWNRKAAVKLKGGYIYDICFVGSLYEDNLYDKYINDIPLNMQDYFVSIFAEAAFRWDGANRIYGKTGREILEYMYLVNPNLKMDNRLDMDDVQVFERLYLVRKIANIERIAILSMLSEEYKVTLHTASDVDKNLLGNVNVKPPISLGEDTTRVFAGSKINLNISLKGIEGGTPQRVMDVMAAGGFMLTNYCPETTDLFEEDKEIVMFKSPEELFDKVDYYLKHKDVRETIAKRGQNKVLECYTYEKKLKKIMDWVEGD